MKKLWYTIYLLFFFSIFIFSLSISIKSNTINTPKEIKFIFSSLTPQGWGFFTRDPKEKLIDIYKIHGSELIKLTIPNSSMSNYFGFSRKSRKIAMEVSVILSKLKDIKWEISYKNNSIVNNTPPYLLDKSNLYYLSHGDYLLVRRTLTPWAWYGRKKNFIPFETIRIQVM